MKKYNFKEASTWAGIGIMLVSGGGFLAQIGFIKAAAIITGLGTLAGGIAGYIPDSKTNVIK